ncbi:mannose-6-phosphate isomerase, class I [Sediminibacterium sp.]|uniref:mannose-6-phosphate isomerase, class I n=1 Tax=Sediminibacterium sp. TaxID=1917865 RepID=UPI003F6F1701
MQLNERIFKLKGVIQHYAWGGHIFIPQLLNSNETTDKPSAEYWMGAHPSAPSKLLVGQDWVSLNQLITEDPETTITTSVMGRFGELPYLFKVLDVKDMLSIQVHPTKESAEIGFAEENKAGIPISAPHRNYKDQNHKPEVMVALSEFWLLHGFKSKEALEEVLIETQELKILLPLFRQTGLKGLYQFVMEMQQEDVNNMLAPLVKRAIRLKKEGSINKMNPAWWAAKLYEENGITENIDRGIFSIYFFNIVYVEKGGAVFQKAGVPHAYLEGQNIELMANSDNVLRGGLTPKHVDVPELMKHTLFESVVPNVMQGNPGAGGEVVYPCPVPDFGLSKIELKTGESYYSKSFSLEIMIVTEGAVIVNQHLVLKKGEAAAILADTSFELKATGNSTIFKAFVPSI